MSLKQYTTRMERQGQKPEWSNERLTAVRQKLAASAETVRANRQDAKKAKSPT